MMLVTFLPSLDIFLIVILFRVWLGLSSFLLHFIPKQQHSMNITNNTHTFFYRIPPIIIVSSSSTHNITLARILNAQRTHLSKKRSEKCGAPAPVHHHHPSTTFSLKKTHTKTQQTTKNSSWFGLFGCWI